MYIIEKIIKLFSKKQHKNNSYMPQDIDLCNHIFLPIDSSGKILACPKCGKVIKKD